MMDEMYFAANNKLRALYSCLDGHYTWAVWEDVESELRRPLTFGYGPSARSLSYLPCYRKTIDLYGPTIFMATHGLLVNKDELEKERGRVRKKIEELQEKLDQITGGKLNPMSPKSCQKYFYIEKGLPPYTNDGKITTDDTALARIARKGFEEASLCQQIRALNKLCSTYLDVKIDEDSRIRCSWNLRGTKEGRLSSSKNIFGTGLNFQNLDPRFKSFIVPDPGHLFVEIDKVRAEWVITAYLAGDARMINAVESGLDVHSVTGSLIAKCPIELVEHEAKILGTQSDPDTITHLRERYCQDLLKVAKFLPRTMSIRQAGKKGNHGLNYREGYRTFALVNEIPEKEAAEIVEGYRTGYCNLPLWWASTEAEIRQTRTLDNCFGRVRRFLGEMNDDLIRRAIAFRPQSTSVDLVNHGMLKIYHDEAPFMYPLKLGAQVHDSILFQYPCESNSDLYDLSNCILRCLEHLDPELEYHGRKFHVASDVKIGLNWGIADYDPFSLSYNPKGMQAIEVSKNPYTLMATIKRTLEEMDR